MLMHTALEVLAQAPPPPGPPPLPPLYGGIPNPPAGVPLQFRGFGDLVVSALKWGLIVCGVAGLLACSIMIVIGRRDRNRLAQQGIFDTVYVLLGLAIGSMAATLVGMFVI